MKRIIVAVALIAFAGIGIFSVAFMQKNVPVTYDGRDTDVLALYQDPSDYDTSDPDGVTDIIVKQNLEKTHAANNVTAVVFDFRGYDTMGEAFILVVAVTGSAAILRKAKKRGEGES